MKAVAKNIGGGAMIASLNVAESQSGPSLLGTWRLVSYEARDPEGRVQYPLGENVSGLLVYDGGGNMSAHVMRNDLPLFAAKDPASPLGVNAPMSSRLRSLVDRILIAK